MEVLFCGDLPRVIPGADDVRLRLMTPQVSASPFVECSNIEILRQLPMTLHEILGNVLVKVAGVIYSGQVVQVFIGQVRVFGVLFKPGIQQQASGHHFTFKRACPGRILTADL